MENEIKLPQKGERWKFNALNPHLISSSTYAPAWAYVTIEWVDDENVHYRRDSSPNKVDQTTIARFLEITQPVEFNKLPSFTFTERPSLIEFMKKWVDIVKDPSPPHQNSDIVNKIGTFKREGCFVYFVEDKTGVTEQVWLEGTEEAAQRMTDLSNAFLRFKTEHNIKNIWPVSMESSDLEVKVGPFTWKGNLSYNERE